MDMPDTEGNPLPQAAFSKSAKAAIH